MHSIGPAVLRQWGNNVDDLRLELRCRNNMLWHLIFDTYESVAEFCRVNQMEQDVVGALLNLKQSPYQKICGQPIRTAQRLCDLSGYGADELFPPELYTGVLGETRVAEISSSRLLALTAARHLALPASADDNIERGELTEAMASVLKTLAPREEKVIRARFGLGEDEHTLEEVGAMFGVNRERVRQIEARALRKLRHRSRSRHLRPFAR